MPLGLILSFDGDDTFVLRLEKLPCPSVVKALARGLLEMTNANGSIKTLWTAKHYRNAIARFSRWLESEQFEGGLSDLTVDHLYSFASGETLPRERLLRTLLRRCHTLEFCGPLSEDVLEYLDGNAVSTVVPSRGHRVPYTRDECDRIKAACQREILDYEAQPNGKGLDRGRSSSRGPGPGVAIAFRLLLGLETGIPSEGLEGLLVQNLRRQGDRDVRIEYRKRRAKGSEARDFHSSGPWGAPALLGRWLALSDQLREHLESECLWVCSYPDGSAAPIKFSEFAFRKWRLDFIRRHRLVDDAGTMLGLDMGRLRTTYHARKQKAWNGSITIDPNHSPQVEGDDYLTASADPDEIDGIVVDAQEDLLRRARLAVVVTADDDDLSDLVDNDELLEHTASPRSAQRDMFGAICRDPYSSPFTPHGQFCVASIWSCLVCPLAVITASKLPALLRLEEFLSGAAAGVPQSEWVRVYAPAWVQLTTRIMPAFSEAALRNARARLNDNGPAPLPIGPDEGVVI